MRSCEDSLREHFFQQLARCVSAHTGTRARRCGAERSVARAPPSLSVSLVGIIKSHVRNFLSQILELLFEFWDHLHMLTSILTVVEECALAVRDEFKACARCPAAPAPVFSPMTCPGA
jgi:hypothetical protein